MRQMIEPVVRQNMWFIFVENNLMYKQNMPDFGRVMNYFEKHICNKMPQFESYYMVSQFLSYYPQIVSKIILEINQKFFLEHDIVLLDYLSVLNYLPKPDYNTECLQNLFVN